MPWYVGKTLPRHESTARWFLGAHPVRVLLPLGSRRIVWRRRLVTRLEPLFPRYIFIESDDHLTHQPGLCHAIDHTPGIVKLLRGASDDPVPLADEWVDAIQSRMVNDAVPLKGPHDPEPNDPIRVVSGKYQGLDGILECPLGDGRAAAFLRLFNRLNPVVLDESDIVLA